MKRRTRTLAAALLVMTAVTIAGAPWLVLRARAVAQDSSANSGAGLVMPPVLVPDIGIPVLNEGLDAMLFQLLEYKYQSLNIQQQQQAPTEKFNAGKNAASLAQKLKEYAERFLRSNLRRKLLQMVTKQIVGFVQGGGAPKFVTDWDQFLKDAGTNAANRFIDDVKGVAFCNFTGSAVAPTVGGGTSGSNALSKKAGCTLNKAVPGGNIKAFQDDFSKGGWNAYLTSLLPNNNPLGAKIILQAERQDRIEASINAAQNEAVAGSGFISEKDCKKDGSCKIKLPGKSIEALLAESITSPIKEIITTDELTSLLSGIANTAIQRLIKEGQGLLFNLKKPEVAAPAGGPCANPDLDPEVQDACNKKGASEKASFAKQVASLKSDITKALKEYKAAGTEAFDIYQEAIANLILYQGKLTALITGATKGTCPKGPAETPGTIENELAATVAKITELQAITDPAAPAIADLSKALIDLKAIAPGDIDAITAFENSIEQYLDVSSNPLTDEAQAALDASKKNLAVTYGGLAADCSDTADFTNQKQGLLDQLAVVLPLYASADDAYLDALDTLDTYKIAISSLKQAFDSPTLTCPASVGKGTQMNKIDAELKLPNGYVNKTFTSLTAKEENFAIIVGQLTDAVNYLNNTLTVNNFAGLASIKNAITPFLNVSVATAANDQAQADKLTVQTDTNKKLNGSPNGFQTKFNKCSSPAP